MCRPDGLRVVIVAALARDRTIGDAGAIPWHYPEDFAHFRRETKGTVLVMGRRTLESIGRLLPGRPTVVLTRDVERVRAAWPGALVADSLEAALEAAAATGRDTATIQGGATVYAEALAVADEMVLTFVPEEGGGDTRFPAWNPAAWREVARETVERVEIVRYARR